MEALVYRCHPQTAKLLELLRGGVIGQVRMIRAAFGFGGILDVGCYPVAMSRLVAGTAAGKPYADPIEVVGGGRPGETGVDEGAAAVLVFEGGVTAQVSTGVRVTLENCLEIYGADGRITVPTPWVANRKAADGGKIAVTVKGESRTTAWRKRSPRAVRRPRRPP